MDADQRVIIGRLGRTHGVTGEIRARATGPTLGTLRAGSGLLLDVAGNTRSLRIASIREFDGDFLMCFDGVDSKELAGALVNATLAVDADRLGKLGEPDEFYVRDLLGCRVWVGESELGPVTDVAGGAANDALVIDIGDGRTQLVPFTHDAVTELDVAGRRIVIRADLFGGGDA